jgi:hypothetical protein
MSRERSYFEHNGMPLQAAPNAGRVRHVQAPWLGSFIAQAAPAEQQGAGKAAVAMTGLTAEVSGMNDEPEGDTPQSSAPKMPLADWPTGAQATDAIQSGANPQHPHSTWAAGADAHANATNIDARADIDRSTLPVIPASLLQAKPARGTETKPAAGTEANTPNRITESAGARSVEPDATRLLPSVLVQKHVSVQTEISFMPTATEVATALPGTPPLPLVVAMGAPPSMSVAAATENSGTPMPAESAAAVALSPAPVLVHFEAARVQMGVSNIPAGNTRPAAMPESRPQNDRSQQALLDRLNDRATPPHQQGGGRRVHIGNLHITVQRPAMAATQTPPLAPSVQPQAASAGQILFNPWERHYMAFD